MKDGITPRDLSLRLGDDIEGVARDLGLDPRRRGRKLVCIPPWGSTTKRKLEIEITPVAGKWNDWHTGVSGDALGLVGCVLTQQADMRTHGARLEGIRWARTRYGLGGGDFDRAAWEANVAQAKARSAEAAKRAAAELKRHRGTAQHVWINADPLRPTTRTHRGCDGARYLEARGIDFGQLGRLPRAVHFSASERWVQMEGTEVVQEHIGPALVSAMTLPGGQFASLHRIWIDPRNPGEKADLDPPRKVWPQSDGARICLWRGENQLTENDAVAKGQRIPLVICEGVEDGLSIAMMTPEYRVHAAGSLPGLASYDPPECVSKIIVAADNDWNKPQAQALLGKAVGRLRGMGKPVVVARSPEGKDFNDLVRGVA